MASVKILFGRDAPPPPCDPGIVELHRYWQSIRPGSGLLPGRQHFDPLMVPRLLPWLWLVDVRREPLRFRYRLVGTVHVEAGGYNPTGQWLDEAHPRFVTSAAFPQFHAAVEEGILAFYAGPATYAIKKDHVAIERLLLPLARDGLKVDMLLGITTLYSAVDLAERSAEALALQ